MSDLHTPIPNPSPYEGEGNVQPSATRKVAVVGGGWAGCAAAVELAASGCTPVLFEAARTLGGRARVVEIDDRLLDNGQHILLGAYSETLRLLNQVGLRERDVLLRLPLQMRYPHATGMDFVAPRLPAPWHMLVALLRAKGLTREDKLALVRFTTTARWIDWYLNDDCTVAELLERYDQTDTLIRLMWRPLCIAALNTPLERASAQVFLNVLRDSLGAARSASDMLVPRVDLTALFPQRAADFVREHGGTLHIGRAVRALHRVDEKWKLDAAPGERFDAVVLALPAAQAAALCTEHAPEAVSDFDYEPITTCYLQYQETVALDQVFYALAEEPSQARWGQFVFDRGQLDPDSRGLLAVVVSVSTEALAQGHDALAAAIAAQLSHDLHMPQLQSPLWHKVITEKRATFSCTPNLQRPTNATAVPGLVLAGDYTAGDYPATLESAVRSGVQAARLLLD